MTHQSIQAFATNLECAYSSTCASSSAASYLSSRMGMSKEWGEKTLSRLKASAESARGHLTEYRGKRGEELFLSVVDNQTLGMSDQEKQDVAAKVRSMITECGFQSDESMDIRQMIRMDESEMHNLCKRLSRFAALHNNSDLDNLLAAFYIACEPSPDELTDQQACTIGYCVGLVHEAARQAREKDPMKAYDAFFSDEEVVNNIALIVYILVIVAIFGVVMLKMSALQLALLYIPVVFTLLAATFAITESLSEGTLRSIVESSKIAKESKETSKAVISETLTADEYPSCLIHCDSTEETDTIEDVCFA